MRGNLEALGATLIDARGELYFHHFLYKDEYKDCHTVILGDPIVFAVVKSNNVTYSLPGGRIQDAVPFVKYLKDKGHDRVILYLRSNYVLGNQRKNCHSRAVSVAVSTYNSFPDINLEKGMGIKLCPSPGLRNKRKTCNSFNAELLGLAQT